MIGGLLFWHLGGFYGWSLPWTIGAVAVGALVLRSVGSALFFLSRHPFAVCDFGLSEAAVPGGAVRCAARIVARRPVAAAAVRFSLTAESRGASRETRRLFSAEREAGRAVALEVGREFEDGADLPVPEDAPFSYRSFEGRLRWLARAEVAVEGYGTFAEEIEVLMAPPPPEDPEGEAGE